MLRLDRQDSQSQLVKEQSSSIDQIQSATSQNTRPRRHTTMNNDNGNDDNDNDDDMSSHSSDSEHFMTKGAFLLTPANEIQMERVAMICDKMNYKGPFSLTKTATGILFKFANQEDYMVTFKKGFHKVTGSRFYKKIPVPCRPQKTFTIFVFEIPEEIPEDDIRHSLYKFRSVVEVYRIPCTTTPQQPASSPSGVLFGGSGTKSTTEKGSSSTTPSTHHIISTEGNSLTNSSYLSTSPSIVQITLASLDECNILLRDGLDFYGATYFPTEPALSTNIAREGSKKTVMHNSRLLDLIATSGLRIRDFWPGLNSGNFSRIPAPISKTTVGRRA